MAESSSTSVGPAPKKPKRSSKWQPEWAHYNVSVHMQWIVIVFLIKVLQGGMVRGRVMDT